MAGKRWLSAAATSGSRRLWNTASVVTIIASAFNAMTLAKAASTSSLRLMLMGMTRSPKFCAAPWTSSVSECAFGLLKLIKIAT